MKRNKYINSFDTTAEYDNYIESAAPGFPNVSLTKDNGKLHYMTTSPNDHVIYGELVDATQALPTISLNGAVNTPTLDTINNMFYLDSWTNTAPTSITIDNKTNIKSIKKFKGLNTSSVRDMSNMFRGCRSLTSLDLSTLDTSTASNMSSMFSNCNSLTSLDLSNFDTSSVTNMNSIFNYCTSLTSLDLSNFDTSSVTDFNSMFYQCNALTDVYITVEATLMKLTNNLTSQDHKYIPSSATIHYNDGTGNVDYKWQNNAWRPQSV